MKDKKNQGKGQDKRDEKTFVESNIKKRAAVVVFVTTICFVVVTCVLAVISLFNHQRYSELAIQQQLRDSVINANRGKIYDTNMNVLAQSATVWTVALSPMDIKEEQQETIATGLSQILGVDYDTIYEKFSERNYYSIVKRKVDQPIVDEIRAWILENNLSGISFTEDTKRYYPYGNFAAQVLGFVGTDNYGLYGLEAYYDSTLAGTAGRIITAKNAKGSQMYYEYETYYEAQEGNSIVLTIDEVIQHYLESALESAVKEHNVKNRACGIVMDVNTGAILAMSTKPDFDPNQPLTIYDETVLAALQEITDEEAYKTALGEAQELQWNNKAITELYEPGSVFKAVTASAALETGACTMNSHFFCNGSYKVEGEVMHCANRNGHGGEDFTLAIVNSCNPAFIQIGQAIGSDDFYNYFKAFGLTEKTGVDLPGELSSIYYTAEQLGPVELASCSFGQSNAITPLQMITAFSAVVNGGYLVQPYIVREVIDSEGNVVESFTPQVKRQVISNETSEQMAEILEQVVSQSSSRNAYVAGYRIGGKSGTSQKLGGQSGVYIASFCAIAPADDPQIAILILLDEANSYSIYGSQLVGPIIASVMSNVLPYMGIDAVYSEEEMKTADITVPNVVGQSLTQTYNSLQVQGLSYTVYGDGTTVTGQFPSGGHAAPRGSTIILYTEPEQQEVIVTVPNVTGRSIDAAQAMLSAAGLNIRINGPNSSGSVAIAQSIEQGETVSAGSVITVEFLDNSVADESL